METPEVDLWGLSRSESNNKYSIQSFFLSIGKRLLHSKEFIDFWDKLAYPKTFYEAVELFEYGFYLYLYPFHHPKHQFHVQVFL